MVFFKAIAETETVKFRVTRGPFLTSPLGANFDPRVEVVPQWLILSLVVKLSPPFF
jgi:hypothetical protein